ncbi:hypothetical protein [Paraburkholderia gardini]|nr:hypothetical protein [Paraburkholderia gardini]
MHGFDARAVRCAVAFKENAGAYVMRFRSVLLTILLGLVASDVPAADFDGSKPLLCATMEAHSCDPGLTCKRSLPADIGAPRFLSVNFEKKVITGPARTTPMLTVNKEPNQVVIEGMEMGYGWTLALDSGDGSMTLMIVNSEDAIVLFGNCTAL